MCLEPIQNLCALRSRFRVSAQKFQTETIQIWRARNETSVDALQDGAFRGSSGDAGTDRKLDLEADRIEEGRKA